MSAAREKPVLLYLVTEDWYFCSHRLPIARAARDAGWDVVVATRVGERGAAIEREGLRLIPIGMRRRSLGPWREVATVAELVRIYRRERPDLVHHVAMKPVLYGSLAARIARIPAVVNALAGMGYVFSSPRAKARLLRPIIRTAFRWLLDGSNSRLVLQNPDDVAAMTAGTVAGERVVLVRGSGVDAAQFQPRAEPEGTPVAVMVSRMLWDKGVGELVEAARLLRRRDCALKVVLVGPPDPENPASIPAGKLQDWVSSGDLAWWGERADIAEIWANSHIAVLPTTYGEGVPKSLLEAAACGRPIVATDTTGCREVVQDGVTGLLVPPRDAAKLADALERLALNADLRRRMGRAARELVERELSEDVVVARTMALYRSLVPGAP
ncbi:MAG: glycosyltransferase family 4 protein [Gammaproteobacteria bacterium]|nr:glycosyltransferase family 4 protein [Gammaproteobacteria bacterium]NIX86744.1 glycosyltransferase [Gammaproteobacteria bacterium]